MPTRCGRSRVKTRLSRGSSSLSAALGGGAVVNKSDRSSHLCLWPYGLAEQTISGSPPVSGSKEYVDLLTLHKRTFALRFATASPSKTVAVHGNVAKTAD